MICYIRPGRKADLKTLFTALMLGLIYGGRIYAGTLTPLGGIAISGQEGVLVYLRADFSDSDPNEPLSAFFVSIINWGDGGDVPEPPHLIPGTGTFFVDGWHNYLDEGTYHPNVAVGNSSGLVTSFGVADISDAPLTDGSALNLSGMVGIPFTEVMATFLDTNPVVFVPPKADFTATINWGDGTSGNGTVVNNSSQQFTSGPQQFSIIGTHTYAAAGTYPYSIDTVDVGGSTITLSGNATVVTADPGSFGLLCLGLGLVGWRRRGP